MFRARTWGFARYFPIFGLLSIPSLAAPTLTRTSAAGAAPLLMDVTAGSTFFAGYLAHFQIATDSGFSTITQNITQIVTADDFARQNLTLKGFVTPSGLYYARVRFERDDGSVSAWSNVITDTILATTMKLDPANKNASITLATGNLIFTGAAQNANMLARSTIVMPAGGNYYAEMTYTTRDATNTGTDRGIGIGVCNAAASMTDFSMPGSGNSNGGGMQPAGSYIYPSTVNHIVTQVAGDIYMIAVSVPATLTNPGKVWIGQNGTWVGGGNPATNTGGEAITLAQWYLFCGATKVDTGTFNPGSSAFTYTKPSGFTAMP